MTEQPTDFFWEVSAAALAHSDVATGTMMGFPCLRLSGAFFASCDHRSGDLIVKLPRHRVEQLIAAGAGQPFAPRGQNLPRMGPDRRPRPGPVGRADRRSPRLRTRPAMTFPSRRLEPVAQRVRARIGKHVILDTTHAQLLFEDERHPWASSTCRRPVRLQLG